MNKKSFRNILLALLALAIPLTSCDDIDEADRVVTGTPTTYDRTFETNTIEVGSESFPIDNEHKLLIADFTGWKCVNCPTVAEALTTKIMPNYPAVLVSLHMTTNSFSMNHREGYNCASADSIANWIAGENIATKLSLPSVSIDNVTYKDQVFNSNTTDLENLASERFKACNIDKTVPQTSISINVTPVGDDTYDISTLLIYPHGHGLTLRLWLIEEELISSLQSSTSGIIRNYINHGVLRQVINGSYEGQNIIFGPEGQAIVHTRLNIAGKGYKPENCRVVAFITQPGGKDVLNTNVTELLHP